jgi:8-oxo-dGTP pyrophosphatase MutT (NUDIX family)
MKNSIKDEWVELLSNKDKLYKHIKETLHYRKQKSFIYKQGPNIPAAVLIPLFFKNNQAHILFTKRTTNVGTHKGQISFPGGKKDDTDPDLGFTALRETREEVGILESDVDVLGKTDLFLTNTDFMVTPFVGTFEDPYHYKPNMDEIEKLIEVPLLHLLDDSIFRVQKLTRNGFKWNIHYYYYNEDIIWGVTGFLLSNFLSIIFGMQRDKLTEINIAD